MPSVRLLSTLLVEFEVLEVILFVQFVGYKAELKSTAF